MKSFHRLVPGPVVLVLVLGLAIAGCATEPGYRPPPIELPTDFRYLEGWQPVGGGVVGPASAADAWWAPYDDPVLARLMIDVAAANPSIGEARARFAQARSRIGEARAAARPTVDAGVSTTRLHGNSTTTSVHDASLAVGWIPDLWGRAALATDAARAESTAAAADIAATRLALQLTAAQGYVRVRALDLQDELLDRTLDTYQRSLELTRRQYDAGLVARSDVIQAETQLQSVRALRVATVRQRVLEENALATLVGRTPAQWRLARRGGPLPTVLTVPPALPSTLLIRRPDVAAAERAIAASHAEIGIARTAWLPTLTLTAGIGVESDRWKNLLDAPARVWSLGPALAARLFDGGARRAETARREAVYDERVEAWRGTVLTAVRETDDALASLSLLADEQRQQQRVVELAEQNERVVTHRYEAGEITFLEVATAQTLSLQSRRAVLDVEAERLLASIRLVTALGGGWDGAEPVEPRRD